MVKPQPQGKKTTKDQTPQPRAKVQSVPVAKAANIALPETAPNGSKINYYPKNDYQNEKVDRLKELAEGGQLFINEWRTVNGKFRPTHILYTYPDEDGNEKDLLG